MYYVALKPSLIMVVMTPDSLKVSHHRCVV